MTQIAPRIFYLTVEGQTPAPFDPNATAPNIVARQGDVEDWIIENRSTELHAFHIHQLHFHAAWTGMGARQRAFPAGHLNVPYFRRRDAAYPSVRLRMDFRDPNTVGTFVYHCHLLEHEDGGMMGLIRVEPASSPREAAPPPPRYAIAGRRASPGTRRPLRSRWRRGIQYQINCLKYDLESSERRRPRLLAFGAIRHYAFRRRGAAC